MRLEGNANTWDRWTHMVTCDAAAFRYSVMELESASSKADDSRHDSKRDTSAWRQQKAHFGPKFSFFRPSQTKSTPRRLYCTIRVLASLVCGVSALSPHDRLTTHCTPY